MTSGVHGDCVTGAPRINTTMDRQGALFSCAYNEHAAALASSLIRNGGQKHVARFLHPPRHLSYPASNFRISSLTARGFGAGANPQFSLRLHRLACDNSSLALRPSDSDLGSLTTLTLQYAPNKQSWS